ncbi:MAG TPA: SBBP repeat-containing protein, partial [Mycobacterium sp.]|nr:SBBP repeat-containing protein [Mycobacterium sp.]
MSDDERPARADGISTPGATPPPGYPLSPMHAPAPVRGKRTPWILIGAVALVVVLVIGGLGAWLLLEHPHQPRQVALPFAGVREPYAVAVDTAGNVYIADANNTAGNVYPADANNNRVLKLPAGSTIQITLPFTGLKNPSGVAVDTAGIVYIADANNNRVLKLPAGSTTQITLPFAGLKNPSGVAVDTAGNVYVTDYGNNRVLRLPAGSNTPVELPFAGLKNPSGVAVDT